MFRVFFFLLFLCYYLHSELRHDSCHTFASKEISVQKTHLTTGRIGCMLLSFITIIGGTDHLIASGWGFLFIHLFSTAVIILLCIGVYKLLHRYPPPLFGCHYGRKIENRNRLQCSCFIFRYFVPLPSVFGVE